MSAALYAYKKPCQQKQRKMSESLCDLYSGTCGPASKQAKQPSGDISTALGGVFCGAGLDGRTLNFNMYTSVEYGLSSSTVLLHLAHIYYAVLPL